MQTTPYLPAIAALAGSAIGGLTSFLGTWLGLISQLKGERLLKDKERRGDLYRDFVNDASTLYQDSLTSQKPDLAKVVGLYALISRMRIISSLEISEEAKKIAQMIFECYSLPNKDLGDIRIMVIHDQFDPIRRFSELCRIELERMR
jgi:hypothetical protein